MDEAHRCEVRKLDSKIQANNDETSGLRSDIKANSNRITRMEDRLYRAETPVFAIATDLVAQKVFQHVGKFGRTRCIVYSFAPILFGSLTRLWALCLHNEIEPHPIQMQDGGIQMQGGGSRQKNDRWHTQWRDHGASMFFERSSRGSKYHIPFDRYAMG